MNRRYPEAGSNGHRERGQSADEGHGEERYGSGSRGSREERAPRAGAPREEETSRWTGEGGSQTYYQRNEAPRQYGGGDYGQQAGGYGSQGYYQGQHNPNQYGGQQGGPYGYGQHGATGGGGGQYASGYGGQYGTQQGHGGTPYGASPNPGSAYAQPWQASSQSGVRESGYGGGGQYASPLGSGWHSPQGSAGDQRGQYGAQPGYGSQQQYGSPYGAQQPYASQYGQQFGGGSQQEYAQHYGYATQGYGPQYASPAAQQSGYQSPQRGVYGERSGAQPFGGAQDGDRSGYGYRYSAGAGYSAGSQYGASGGYGQGSQSEGSNRGRGPKNYTRSTERLREDVCERLADDPYIDAGEIDVTVAENGRIVIEGSVEERWMKHRIEDMIDATPGVQQIENRLTVSGARGTSQYGAQSGSQYGSSQSRGTSATAASGSTSATGASGTSTGTTAQSTETTKRH